MKKRILILFAALSLVTGAKAQLLPTFDFGVKAGMNFTNLQSEGSYLNSNSRAGFLAGSWGRLGVIGLHLQPEVYFTNKNVRVQREGINEENAGVSTIDVPVLIGTKFGIGPVGARIQTGPLFSFIMSKNVPTGSSWRDNFTSWAFGAGADVSKFSLDLRYELGLGRLTSSVSQDRSSLNLWTLALGYKIF